MSGQGTKKPIKCNRKAKTSALNGAPAPRPGSPRCSPRGTAGRERAGSAGGFGFQLFVLICGCGSISETQPVPRGAGQCSERAGGWDKGEPARAMQLQSRRALTPAAPSLSRTPCSHPPIHFFSFQIVGAASKRVCLTSKSDGFTTVKNQTRPEGVLTLTMAPKPFAAVAAQRYSQAQPAATSSLQLALPPRAPRWDRAQRDPAAG